LVFADLIGYRKNYFSSKRALTGKILLRASIWRSMRFMSSRIAGAPSVFEESVKCSFDNRVLGDKMIFITLFRWKKKPTKATAAEGDKLVEQMKSEGAKILGRYWTLGRYDGVLITEGKNEKTAMKGFIRFGDLFSFETLVAVPREEAVKLLE
jgi:uncharacterized protein with GYD domain